ncbi:L,D-transpeptidase family protein [Mesorhizobium sp. WSM4303]|uniref:L,D-transpeptidase family protein n=1 Tax=Mesorhizobium sp. WSM4303 TaxID=2589887 RepID=UPI0032B1282D
MPRNQKGGRGNAAAFLLFGAHPWPSGFGWLGWLLQLVDWTDGCIGVTDSDMDEIWAMVPDGTPIGIEP